MYIKEFAYLKNFFAGADSGIDLGHFSFFENNNKTNYFLVQTYTSVSMLLNDF